MTVSSPYAVLTFQFFFSSLLCTFAFLLEHERKKFIIQTHAPGIFSLLNYKYGTRKKKKYCISHTPFTSFCCNYIKKVFIKWNEIFFLLSFSTFFPARLISLYRLWGTHRLEWQVYISFLSLYIFYTFNFFFSSSAAHFSAFFAIDHNRNGSKYTLLLIMGVCVMI